MDDQLSKPSKQLQSKRISRNVTILRWARRIMIAGFMVMFGFASAQSTAPTADPSKDPTGNTLGFAIFSFLIIGGIGWVVGSGLRKAIFDDATQELGISEVENDPWLTRNPVTIASPLMRYGTVDTSSGFLYRIDGTDWLLTTTSSVMQTLPLVGGSSTQFSLEYMVLSIPLTAHVPHIFIDGTKQNSFAKSQDMWSLNRKLSRRNRLQDLEGDFYKFFDVYTVNKDYLAALSILTPDVMLRMRNKGYDFDYELYDNHLYVIRDARLGSIEDLRDFLAAARSCLDELVPQITKHTYDEPLTLLPMHKTKVGLLAYVFGARILLRKFAILVMYTLIGIFLSELFFM